MSEEPSFWELMKKIPELGLTILLSFILGMAITVLLVSPFKDVPWIYDRIMFGLTHAASGLPTYIAWWGVISIGVISIKIGGYICEEIKQYIKKVAHEEETEQ